MPGVDDFEDDDREGQGGDSALERFRNKARKIEESSGADDDDDSDETDEPVRMERNEDDGTEEPVVQLSRKEKKRERLRLREEAESQRRENAELRERLARLEGQQSALQRQTNTRDETDDDDDAELDRKLDELSNRHKEAWEVLKAKGANATQADKDAYQATVKRIEKEKLRATAETIYERKQAESQVHVQQEIVRQGIRAKYPDVYGNPNAVQYAEGEYRKLIAMGKPDGEDTLHAAMSEARRAFRLTRAPEPTPQQRARFAGTSPPRRGGAVAAEPESIKMTKELRKMADSAFSHIPNQEKRYEAWARGPGKAYLASIKKGD